MGVAVFPQNPTSIAVRQMLGRAIINAGCAPSHLITDQGTQFTEGGFRRWCRRRGIRQRFGAVQKYGSISVIERLLRSMKSEALRRIVVPLDRRAIQRGPCLILAGVFPREAFAAFFPAQPMVEMTQISDFTFGGPVHLVSLLL